MSGPQHKLREADTDRDRYPASPCNSLCTLDDDNRCLGCSRTLEQISRWSLMSKEEQWAVVDELSVRHAG
jgi:predicted Fe-S protein YdhL (DUF1289 family)